ncbi:DNA-binding response regulator [Nonomuraea fastidiosa]|uniref:DNA-binding response regulator n=1 Tax=Nonomuraea fastidiosa TaxID=46173 RepID=UPI003671FB7C
MHETVERAAYRVIQEALTNVHKHAAGAGADVLIRYGEDELRVEVRNEAPRTSGANGGKGRPPNPPKLIMLTTFDLDEYVHEALRLGAVGFLLKDTPPRELAAAVRTVAAGQAMLAPSVTKHLIASYARRTPSRAEIARRRLAALTGREEDVIRALPAACPTRRSAASCA